MGRAAAHRSIGNAARIRRFYDRRRQGHKVYALELDEVAIEEMLIHEAC
jgi:hypothetical protein